jgi:hypothetical protein
MEHEICNECGKSVQFGTGLYTNRIFDFNGLGTRIEMLKPFPEGDFICVECDEKINQLVNAGNKRISN